MPEHGGDSTEMERLYGRPNDGWLDLSTGINPKPYPVKDLSSDKWGALPSSKDITRLCDAAAHHYGAHDASLVMPAPGTQSLIQSLPRIRQASRVCVMSPTYNEHAHNWRMAGHDVLEINDLSEVSSHTDVIIVVNPNNPDGRRLDPEHLKSVAQGQAAKGGWLIVDEAFCDVTPELSLAGSAGAAGLIILRSFGKFFGLAGLRLGFALADTTITGQLSNFLGPWSVSTPALHIGAQALCNDHWTNRTRQALQESANRMDQLLGHAGYTVTGGTSLFRLVSGDNAATLFGNLARNGILTRRFDYDVQWLRVGIPGRETDWKRFDDALGTPAFKAVGSPFAA